VGALRPRPGGRCADRAGPAAGAGGDGADRAAFRPLLENLPAADGDGLPSALAGSGGEGAFVGGRPVASDRGGGAGDLYAAEFRDVRRAFRVAGRWQDYLPVVVRGGQRGAQRRGVPARRGEGVLLFSGARDLSDLPR